MLTMTCTEWVVTSRYLGIQEAIGVWDTRNSSFYPRSGLLAEGYMEQYSRVWASDMTFGFFHLDVRGYIPAGKEGVVALLVKEAF